MVLRKRCWILSESSLIAQTLTTAAAMIGASDGMDLLKNIDQKLR
jgi:hypothetical protein